MSYVPNYKHDIFVSYAHVDDNVLPGAKKGWVTTLIECIETKLAQRLGRPDDNLLWTDHELARHVRLTEQITDALRQTAILLVVLSPGYLASEWCQRERSTFLQLVKEGHSRVFIIERDDVEPTERPSEFNDLMAFRFWVRDRRGKPPRILGDPEPSPNEPEYYSRVDEITEELAQELRKLRAEHQGLPGSDARPGKPTVFLAEVTDDLEQERAGVKSYLTQFDINVLPNTCYSQTPGSFIQSARSDLAKCVSFVQLLSGIAGKKPPDLPQGYGHLQLELAKAAGKPIFQWRSPSLDAASIQDENHRALVNGPEVRAEGIEDFKRTIKDSILVKPATVGPIRPSAFVFVNMETADRPLAEKVCTVLERNGVDYILPLETGDPEEIRSDMEENLKGSDGIIIVYGSSTAGWVRRQLQECRKILSKRERPLNALAVFEGPPEQKCQIDLKLGNLQFLNCRRGFENTELENELKAFIDSLKREEF